MKTRFISYYPGQIIGDHGVTYVSEAEWRQYRTKKLRMITFKCRCGKLFVSTATKVKTGHTTSCGCYRDMKVSEVNIIHGMSNHWLRFKWSSIKGRIFNPHVKVYKNYGGRGITMFPPWIHDFVAFHNYVITLPDCGKAGYSLDRIDNNGNYEPGNLRWTTMNVQTRNRRKLPANTSGYVGVSYDTHHEQWLSYIYDRRKRITLYRGKSKKDAINRREEYIIRNQLIGYKLNLQ